MILRKNLHWFIYPLFILACARQTTPTGGPKDSIPPKLVNSIPGKEQINYKGKQIELSFTEMIGVNNPKEQMIITPDVGKDYEFQVKKERVIFTFEKDFEDSTTYSINFREAIQDITEKNPAVNLKLAFSTGTYIDSLSIAGSVYNPLKSEESEDATVALYQQDTFNIFKHKPSYLTKTDEKGEFIIENLKPGKYYLYAMEDRNKNLVIDSKSESYGFIADTLHLKENIEAMSIPLVRLDTRPLKITSARIYNTYYNIKASKGLADYKIKATGDDIIISSFGEDRSGIKVFNTIENKDSVEVKFSGTDSLSNKVDTTLYVKFTEREVAPEKFNVTIENMKLIASKGKLTGSIKFSKPVLQVNYDSIFYKIDSLTTVPITAQDLTWDSLNNILKIDKTLDKKLLVENIPANSDNTLPDTTAGVKREDIKKQFEWYLGKSAFISIEMDSSAKLTQSVKPLLHEELGIILVSIETTEPHFFVELLDKSFQVVQKIKDKKKPVFEDLPPSEYQLRLIIDENNNGEWDAGNFFRRQEPEPIIFYKNETNSQAINLKANWELGPLLIKY